VRIETPENIQMSEREDNEGHVVSGDLEERLDENNDTTQEQVLADIEVEVPILSVTDNEVTPVKNENRAFSPQSASQQSVNGKSGGYTYSHRAALKARMASLNSTDSGSGSGSCGLSGASAVDTCLASGSSSAPTSSSHSSQDFSYAAFQSAALQVFLYLLVTVTLIALLVLTHALVFSLSPA
jgi:hypothetical protein